MDIGVLTYYGVHNHGAVLQANALRSVLMSKGHQCNFLMFERSYSNIPQKQVNKYKFGLGSIPFYAKYVCEKGIGNILYNFKKKKTLESYRNMQLPLTERYDAFAGDLAIIGSDEVFSLEVGTNPFLYGNGLKAKHIMSYAGCFGPTSYEEIVHQGQQDMISTGLNGMDAVSVRDLNSQEIVKKIAGIKATLVCDPVILYGYQREMNEFIPPQKNYILIYAYDKNMNDEGEYSYIKAYAKRKGLEVISVGYHHKWCKSINASPVELLGWIKNAELVVTDTFHGSVMSIICNTPMVVKLRGNSNKLGFLLSEYDLLDRMISDFSELGCVADQMIDFEHVNMCIRERRESSMRFLDGVLEKIRN